MSKDKSQGPSDIDGLYQIGALLAGIVIVVILFILWLPILLLAAALTWFALDVARCDSRLSEEQRMAWIYGSWACAWIFAFGFSLGEFTFRGLVFFELGGVLHLVVDGVSTWARGIAPFGKKSFGTPGDSALRFYFWSPLFLSGLATFLVLRKWGGRRGVRSVHYENSLNFLRGSVGWALQPGQRLSDWVSSRPLLRSALFGSCGILALVRWKAPTIELERLTESLFVLGSWICLTTLLFKPCTETNGLSRKVGDLVVGSALSDGLRPAVALSENQLRHHVHIIGATGYGKTNLILHILQGRIQQGSGILFMDLKSELDTLRVLVDMVQKAGRLDDLLFFSVSRPDLSVPYNVVARGTANEINDRIVAALDWSEEFYKNEATSVLLKVLRALCAERESSKRAFDLSDVLAAIKRPDRLAEAKAKIPMTPEWALIHSEIVEIDAYLRDQKSHRNLQGLRSQLEQILLTDFGSLIACANSPGIDLFRAAREGKIVIFYLDSRRYQVSASVLGKIILSDLITASSRIDGTVEGAQRKTFSVVIDEFADLVQPAFLSFLDRARSSGMGVIVSHQELSDLKKVSPEFATRLMHNTATQFVFQTKGSESAEIVASTAGTVTTEKFTERVSRLIPGIDIRTGERSVREAEEYLVHPNVFKNLGQGECVVIGKYPKASAALVKVSPPIPVTLSTAATEKFLSERSSKFKIKRLPEAQSPLVTEENVDGSKF